MERQFKEKLKSIKTFEACLYTAVFKYQNLHRGAITVGTDDPGEAPVVLYEGGSLLQKLDGCFHFSTPLKTGVAQSAEVA